MIAATWRRTGPAAEVIEIGPQPLPAPPERGQVLVRVGASGVNPHDTKRRSGWLGPLPPGPAVIPHSDGAGVIAAVGEGVDPARIGQRVWVFRAGSARPRCGTAAAFCVVDAVQAVPLPDGVSMAEGAALGVPCLTAHSALFMDGPLPAEAVVLVHAGAGAVGEAAVRFAARAGARVIATASTPEKQAIARAAGATEVLDYRDPACAGAILDLTGGKGVHRIIEVDFAANQALAGAVIRPHGVIASYSSTHNPKPVLDYYLFAMKAVTLHFVQGMLLQGTVRDAAVAATRQGVEQGWLRPRLGLVVSLARIAEAQAAVEAGTSGKAIVTLPDGPA